MSTAIHLVCRCVLLGCSSSSSSFIFLFRFLFRFLFLFLVLVPSPNPDLLADTFESMPAFSTERQSILVTKLRAQHNDSADANVWVRYSQGSLSVMLLLLMMMIDMTTPTMIMTG